MNILPCGCVLHGTACAFCRVHSEASPPPEFRPGGSAAEQADRSKPFRSEVGPDDAIAPGGTRQRWNPTTGVLDEPERKS